MYELGRNGRDRERKDEITTWSTGDGIMRQECPVYTESFPKPHGNCLGRGANETSPSVTHPSPHTHPHTLTHLTTSSLTPSHISPPHPSHHKHYTYTHTPHPHFLSLPTLLPSTMCGMVNMETRETR